MRNLGEVPLPPNVGDFRLMSRRVVDAVQQLREHHRFMKGLFAWVGFPSTAVVYDREPRGAGTHQVVVLETVEFRDRGHHQLQCRAAEAGHLSWAGGRRCSPWCSARS